MTEATFTRHTITLDPESKAIFEAADIARAGLSATIRRMAHEWQAQHPPALDDTTRKQLAAMLAEASAKYTTEEE